MGMVGPLSLALVVATIPLMGHPRFFGGIWSTYLRVTETGQPASRFEELVLRVLPNLMFDNCMSVMSVSLDSPWFRRRVMKTRQSMRLALLASQKRKAIQKVHGNSRAKTSKTIPDESSGSSGTSLGAMARMKNRKIRCVRPIVVDPGGSSRRQRKEEPCFLDSTCVQLVISKTKHELVQIMECKPWLEIGVPYCGPRVNDIYTLPEALLTLLSVHGLDLPVGEEGESVFRTREIVSEEDS
ncbi:hypothetical protein B0H65DRAFT_15747 [Neurospora tetraspora]|uniref:Secreted protein n=1 Tax=Neurospora tetraspora TaxID=94610 RepID=A0AAE0MVH5_9PEZI|nr:hypothetical protein B0H65DRAFT_15747 [Neurospora tetraspora]